MKETAERHKRRDDHESFTHDVFLSHSSADKTVVRELAERLRGDGIRVWFDEWEIKFGDSIPEVVPIIRTTRRAPLDGAYMPSFALWAIDFPRRFAS
jgi:hypothetical protein